MSSFPEQPLGERDESYPYAEQATSEWGSTDMKRYAAKGPHIGHKLHLCELVGGGGISLEQVKTLVKDAKFICKSCGRVAAKELNLCDPVPLKQ